MGFEEIISGNTFLNLKTNPLNIVEQGVVEISMK